MKKTLVMFGLAMMGMFSSCDDGDGNDKKSDPRIVPVNNAENNKVTNPPCIIEVPCNEAELDAIDAKQQRKFYNFCDSTVMINYWRDHDFGNASTGGDETIRYPFDQVHGDERKELEWAAAKYRSLKNQ